MKYIMILLVNIAMIVSAPVKQTFNIEGMMCGYGCVNKVKTVLNSIEGVKKCDVNFEKSLMTVEFDEEKVNSHLIITSLTENTTYKTSIMANDYKEKQSFWNKIKNIFKRNS